MTIRVVAIVVLAVFATLVQTIAIAVLERRSIVVARVAAVVRTRWIVDAAGDTGIAIAPRSRHRAVVVIIAAPGSWIPRAAVPVSKAIVVDVLAVNHPRVSV